MSKVIRLTTPLELADLLNLAYKYRTPHYDCDKNTFLNQIIRWYQDKRFRFYLIYEERELVAFTIVLRETGLHNRVFIQDMFVDEDFCGKGFSYLMAAEIAKDAQEINVDKVVWNSSLGFWGKHASVLGYDLREYTIFEATRSNDEILP